MMKTRVVAVAIVAGTGIVGCRSYQPSPIEIDSIRTSWIQRDLSAIVTCAGDSPSPASEPTFHAADGVTLREGEAIALVFNGSLRNWRSRSSIAKVAMQHAGIAPDPVLGFDFERIISGIGGANPWVVGGTLGLTIPLSGSNSAAHEVAVREVQAEYDALILREWEVRMELRRRWVEWSAVTLRLEGMRTALTELDAVATQSDLQQHAGLLSRSEARHIRIEIATIQSERMRLESESRELELRIRGCLGVTSSAEIRLIPQLTVEEVPWGDPVALRHQAERGNPALNAKRSAYAVTESELKREIRKQYPDLVIGPGYGEDQGDSRFLMGLQIPLSLWNRNKQAIETAIASRDAAKVEFETSYEACMTAIDLAVLKIVSAEQRHQFLERNLLPLVEQHIDDARRAATAGSLDAPTLLAAISGIDSARSELVQARAQQALAMIELVSVIGPQNPIRPQSDTLHVVE
jgi:outer membrane protein TolC